MALFESIVTGEIARRRRVGEARSKALADPSKIQNLVASMMKSQVPEEKKIKPRKHPTKLAAVEAAIPRGDPRRDMGSAIFSSYEEMMADPRYEGFRPRDLIVAAGEMELDKRREAIHRYTWAQKTGTFRTLLAKPVVELPGQAEWEAREKPRHFMRAEEAAAIGAGFKGAVEAGKWAFGKGAAARPLYAPHPSIAAPKVGAEVLGRRGAIRLLARGGPWMKLAAAAGVAIPSFRIFEEIEQRVTEKALETEYGREHPAVAQVTGIVAGIAGSGGVVFGGLKKATDKLLEKFMSSQSMRTHLGEEVVANPKVENLMRFWDASKAEVKAAEGVTKAVGKERGRLLDVLTRRMEIERGRGTAIPLPGAVARRRVVSPEERELMRIGVRPGFPPAGEVIKYTPKELAAARKYAFKDIKTREGVEKVIGEVSEGAPREEAVQLVGEMEAGVWKHYPFKYKEPQKVGSKLKGSIKALGYSDSEIEGLTYEKALKIKKAVRATEARVKETEELGNLLTVKKSKIDVSRKGKPGIGTEEVRVRRLGGIAKEKGVEFSSGMTMIYDKAGKPTDQWVGPMYTIYKRSPETGIDRELFSTGTFEKAEKFLTGIETKKLSQEEKLYKWARELSPQKRATLVERGTIPEAVNRRIVQEQRVAVEAGPEYKGYAAEEAMKDERFLESLGSGEVATEEGTYKALSKKEFVARMLKGEKGEISLDFRDVEKLSTILNRAMVVGSPLQTLLNSFGQKLGSRIYQIMDRTLDKTGKYPKGNEAEAILREVMGGKKKLAIGAIGAGIGAEAVVPEEAEAGYIDSLAKVFKAATSKEATKVAEKLGMRYEGVQKFKDCPFLHMFTDTRTGSTITTSTAKTEEVAEKLAENRALWEKTGDIAKGFVAAMSTIPLLDVLSPRQAEAGGIPGAAGRVVTEMAGDMIKKSSPGNLSKLLGSMKKLGIIPEKQIDPHILPEPMRPIRLIPNLKDISTEATDLSAIGQRVLSPMTQFWHYTGIKGGRELQNNAATQWANAQTTAIYNTIVGQRTLMRILEDYVPGYKSSAKPLIEAMKPVVSAYYKPMQERAYHLGMKDYFEKLSAKEWKKIQRKTKFKKGEEDEALAALEILENKTITHQSALAGSENLVRDYQAAWRKIIEPMSKQPEHAGVRIFLAAEDTAKFEHYPWLKDALSFEEKAAASKIKDMMDIYSIQVVEAGEKIITKRPFMHHAWHPGMDTKAVIKDIKRKHPYTTYPPPMAKLHSRAAGFMPMVPDAEYSVTTYLQDINTRLEALNFWRRGEKDGWWAFKQAITENPGIAPEGLVRAFRAFEDGFKPIQKTTVNKWAERMYAFEVARLLAFSLSVPFKHSLKLLSDLRIFGVEGAKAMPKALTSTVKIAIKQRGGEQWLKDKGWGLDVMDEAVEALTETGKMYRLVADISPFRVTETMGDKLLMRFNEIGGSPVSAIERLDRAVSVVASMKMAAKKGMTPAQATYSVFDTILKSNFLSGSLNPGWLRNPKIRLMMVFQGTPYKIMEQRAMLYKRGGQALVDTVKQLQKDVKAGERDFKWEMIKQGLSKEKDLFGTPILTQCMRELMLVGTAVTAGKWLWDVDLAHHFFHPPFVKFRTREIAVGASPMISAGLATFMEKEDAEDECMASTFFREWFGSTIKGVPAPIPVNFKKQLRLSQDDIPEIYRGSKFKYLFGIPAEHED